MVERQAVGALAHEEDELHEGSRHNRHLGLLLKLNLSDPGGGGASQLPLSAAPRRLLSAVFDLDLAEHNSAGIDATSIEE